MSQKYLVRLEEEDISYEVRAADGRFEVRRNEDMEWCVCELERVGESDLYLLMVDDRPTEIYMERRRGGARVTIGRHIFDFDVGPWRPPDRRSHSGGAATGLVRVVAPMTGSIVEVRCAPGDPVQKGDVLLVIESMKMNNELRSPSGGIVESVPVSAGQRVTANELLVAVRRGEG